MDELYKNAPAGICGNDDLGQTSAWYVFSAMGFYPVNPVSGRYEIGTPIFRSASVNIPGGKKFTVTAPNVSKENIYVKEVKFNGQPYRKSYITHDMIRRGGNLEFTMTSEPGILWFDIEK